MVDRYDVIIDRAGGGMPFELYGRVNGYPLYFWAEKGFWVFSLALDPAIPVETVDSTDGVCGWSCDGIYHTVVSDAMESITYEEAWNLVKQSAEKFARMHTEWGWLPMYSEPK